MARGKWPYLALINEDNEKKVRAEKAKTLMSYNKQINTALEFWFKYRNDKRLK